LPTQYAHSDAIAAVVVRTSWLSQWHAPELEPYWEQAAWASAIAEARAAAACMQLAASAFANDVGNANSKNRTSVLRKSFGLMSFETLDTPFW
jgi:hypothetical protein